MTSTRLPHHVLCLLAALCLSLVVAPAAAAAGADDATLPRFSPTSVRMHGSLLVVQAGGDSANRVQVSPAPGGGYLVQDSVPVVAQSADCRNESLTAVRCVPAAAPLAIVAHLGRGADTFTNATALASDVDGGAGRDVLKGGTGRDAFTGGTGRDAIATGAGADRIWALDREADRVRCGAGDDEAFGDKRERQVVDCERETRR